MLPLEYNSVSWKKTAKAVDEVEGVRLSQVCSLRRIVAHFQETSVE